ncbi:hypothetical protein ORV05_20990 [Amycolatopsis cynarae]|uniref:PH domain-containing protein n=1 Tax=Amycolatopsis cynarae TaxID=2995223 RepID=A0ABY7AXZ2_9PSEU|nr:hypothetical protein [Amycolatopsis sp. HUAS 11-8]WAL63488.1 hypothetical protein ORV05_20990 [Amycolatopsis sp. HUAS 11-8]
MTEPAKEPKKQAEPERLPLYSDDAAARRRRLRSGLAGVLLFAAAFGGVAGLIGGQIAGLVVAVVVGLPLLYVVLFSVRRRVWLEGTEVLVRTWRTRRVDIVQANRIDLLVTDVRGMRTVSLLLNAGQHGRTAKIDLAVYAGTGGRELGVLALRRLANALMNNIEANGMVFSELLVAQLRSEARGDGAADRPLYRLASAAPSGRLAQRFTMEAVNRFVAHLD